MPRLRATRLTAIASAVRRLVESVFAGASAAYSTRIPGGSTYSGPLLRVRRSSDNAERDINALAVADANGNRWLDEQTLTLFCGAPKFPLDAVSGAAAAFSLRLLRASYTGPCIRVRRSSDNAEQDIGFTAAGGLDTVALLAFVGANSGFVVTWYDQSLIGRSVTNATVLDQPLIVNAGVYQNEINFNASGTPNRGRLLFAPELTLAAYPYTTNTVLRQLAAQPSILLGRTSGGVQFFRVDGLTAARFTPGNGYGATFDASVPIVLTQTMSSATAATGWANGTSVGSTTTAAGQGLTTSGIGAWSGNQSFFAMRELLIFPSALAATDRENLERSQSAYYGIAYASTIPSAFVTAWYDQSGNGRNAVQATAASQPRIVNAGVVDVMGGRPAPVFSGAQWLSSPFAPAQEPLTLSAVAVRTGTTGNAGIFGTSGTSADTGNQLRISPDNRAELGRFSGTAWVNILGATTITGPSVFSATINASRAAQLWLNGTTQGTVTLPAMGAATQVVIGRSAVPGAGEWMQGQIAEVALAVSAFDNASRQTLKRSQGTAFGITVA